MRADFLNATIAKLQFIMEVVGEVDDKFSDRLLAIDEEVKQYVHEWIDKNQTTAAGNAPPKGFANEVD